MGTAGQVCTTAYALCCLRLSHLPSKAAERRFLERVPLPVKLRSGLWLDDPAEWMRLAEAAEAWGLRESLDGRGLADRCELAERWWAEEVVPVLERVRSAGIGLDLRDVQLHATALAISDRHGCGVWPADLEHRLGARIRAEPPWPYGRAHGPWRSRACYGSGSRASVGEDADQCTAPR